MGTEAHARLSRCVPPSVTSRRISTYTVLGFAGYAIANLIGGGLASVWGLSIGERAIVFFAPGLAFIATIAVAKRIAGHEKIVFYQAALAAVGSVIVLGLIAGAQVARLLDLVTVGLGVFLVFGRLGCHAVACCHGTLGRGVTYGPAHVAVGFWARWAGRALWPVQLVEAVTSGALVIAALVGSGEPGRATIIYTVGYAAARFAFELVRGDGARPYPLGVSEAQWVAVVTAIACAAWRPHAVTIAIAGGLAIAAGVLVIRRQRRALWLPPHLFELDAALRAASGGERRETSGGIQVSRHGLPDGRSDWILSSQHPQWSEATVRRLAHAMWPAYDVVPGRIAGVFHVITA